MHLKLLKINDEKVLEILNEFYYLWGFEFIIHFKIDNIFIDEPFITTNVRKLINK